MTGTTSVLEIIFSYIGHTQERPDISCILCIGIVYVKYFRRYLSAHIEAFRLITSIQATFYLTDETKPISLPSQYCPLSVSRSTSIEALDKRNLTQLT